MPNPKDGLELLMENGVSSSTWIITIIPWRFWKNCDASAASSEVATKIVNPSVKHVEKQPLMRFIIVESFSRNLDYEIVRVGKKFEANIAGVTTTSIEAFDKILKFKILIKMN